jgi:SAM-dependent methyltransferase
MQEVWEGRYLAGDTPWDKGTPAPPLADYLREHKIDGEILVPGCGFGHEVRLLASRGARVTGLDIAPSAVLQARQFAPAADERYLCGDIFHPDPELQNRFDWVVEHTCFCAIRPEQRELYRKGVLSVLKAGGRMFAIFYLNPEAEEGPPFRVGERELDLMFGGLFEEEARWTPSCAFPGREGREQVRVLRKL